MPRRGRGGGVAVSRSYARASPQSLRDSSPPVEHIECSTESLLSTSPPEGEMPRRGRGGDRRASPLFARLGASPSVAARQLPLGGSDWDQLNGIPSPQPPRRPKDRLPCIRDQHAQRPGLDLYYPRFLRAYLAVELRLQGWAAFDD